MARTALTPQYADSDGAAITWTNAAVDGHSIPLVPGMLLLVRNNDVASINATIPTPGTIDGLAINDRVIAVAPSTIARIGLRGNQAYAQNDGTAWINISAIANVSLALIYVR